MLQAEKRLLLALVFFCSAYFLHAQSCIYIGYTVGRYNTPEIAPQNYATKFNLGWKYEQDYGSAAIPRFRPDTIARRLDNALAWSSYATGITFGFILETSSHLGIEMGFHRLNQKSSGTRTNLGNNTEEKFTMQSRTGSVSTNFLVMKNRHFMPYAGADFFSFRFRYNYESSEFDVKKQPIGLKKRLFFVAFNFGAQMEILNFNDAFSLRLIPQYQWHFVPDELPIDPYSDMKFNHNNFSLSAVLAIHL
jgi:hypothetical protein